MARALPWFLLLMWVSFSGSRAHARPARGGGGSVAGQGRVIFVSSERIYVDRGTSDGFSPGAEIIFSRRGKRAGACTLEVVSATRSSCKGMGIREGDEFALPAAPKAKVEAEEPEDVPSAMVLDMRRRKLEATSVELVKAKPRGIGIIGLNRAEISYRHQTWASTRSSRGAFQAERFDLSLPGAPLGGGFDLYLQASVTRWSRIYDDTRFPYRRPADLEVDVLEFTRRVNGSPLAVSFGRFLPYVAPGLGQLDGTQVGYRSGGKEIGVIVGALPAPFTRDPSLQTPLVALYGGWLAQGNEGDVLRWGRLAARASLALPREQASISQVELSSRGVFWDVFDLGGIVRVGTQGDPRAIEHASVDAQIRWAEQWKTNLGYRRSLATPYFLGELDGIVTNNRSEAFDGDVSVDVFDNAATVAFLGSFRRFEDEQNLERLTLGPELTFRKLGPFLLSGGYREELGWLRARGYYGQLRIASANEGFSLLTRVSLYQEVPRGALTYGGFFQTNWAVTDWVELRAFLSAYERTAILEQGGSIAFTGELGLGLKL